MDEESILKKRFAELADRAYQSSRYFYTPFLSMTEISLLHSMDGQIGRNRYRLYGGTKDCERCVAQFGDPEEIGYAEAFPICCIKITPRMQKYADQLTHRDVLGSVMALGIERDSIGDILLHENCGYLFCLERMKDYVMEHLTQVKHTPVQCALTTEIPDCLQEGQTLQLQVHTARIDALVCKLYRLSRNAGLELFREKKIFVNGRQCENNSAALKENDVISVRGYGRFRYEGIVKTTRKGNLAVQVVKY